MGIINTSLVGARKHPLLEAQRFVLNCCCCYEVPVERYPNLRTLSAPEIGGVRPEVEYSVQIVVDEYEIHAYLRQPLIGGQKPVFEIVFSRDEIDA